MSEAVTVRRALAQAGLVPIDARILLAHVLQKDRAWLVAHDGDALRREQADAFFALAARRRDGEPVAYLTGEREFYGLALHVSSAVLIPRPETETVVEVALSCLPIDRDTRVLDLGTGSGAIALALAHERPRAKVIATDASSSALSVARDNARRLNLANVEFVPSDWYGSIAQDARFTVIASNPPYVARGDPHLAEGDLRFEPPAALASGSDGLDALRRIVGGARERLVPGGALVVEHGYDQAERVRRLFDAAGFGGIASAKDLAGIERVVVGVNEDRTR